ncbi:MAG TPA: ATP-binding protein [Candidatus Kapabacteria bacterium]|nr:ATP-binding protein [Candidatus Kapabacteria bacterium]
MEKKFKLTESETVELKSSLSERHEILDTISAFSNTKGGAIYVGIDPQGRVIGIDEGYRTFEDLANEIKQNTDPKVFPTIEGIKIENKNVLLIKVAEYPTKPVWATDGSTAC